jgi:hypothetical protein
METRQYGGVILFTLLGSIMLIIAMLLSIHEQEMPMLILGSAIPILALAVLLFYKLSVKVTNEKVAISFGIGFIRRSFSINDIVSCKAVTNKWWYGWGIHFLGNTTIYNVSGMKAIELTFRSSGRKVRIGTDQPEELSLFINEIAHNRLR